MTDWYTEPQRGRQWLLGNGEIVDEPVMEASGSRRRARVFGKQSTSIAYARRHEAMLAEVARRAKAKKTHSWMPLLGSDLTMYAKGCKPEDGCTDLFLLAGQPGRFGSRDVETKVYWTFQHPTLPIRAQVVIEAGTRSATQHIVLTKLSVPDTRPNRLAPSYYEVVNDTFTAITGHLANVDHEAHAKVSPAVEKPPAYLDEANLGLRTFNSERQAAKHLLDSVRWADSLESIQIPDARTGKPEWVELELVETNFNASLTTDLTEYLTNGPTVDQALEHYEAFTSTLRSLGLVLPKVSENQIMRLLLAGDDQAVTLDLASPMNADEDEIRLDASHALSMHLTTGTFFVRCHVKPENTQDVADSWAEAHAIASITGKETELLAYAREFARTNDDRKTRRLVARRKAGLIVQQ